MRATNDIQKKMAQHIYKLLQKLIVQKSEELEIEKVFKGKQKLTVLSLNSYRKKEKKNERREKNTIEMAHMQGKRDQLFIQWRKKIHTCKRT